jgi:hypothetical protein
MNTSTQEIPTANKQECHPVSTVLFVLSQLHKQHNVFGLCWSPSGGSYAETHKDLLCSKKVVILGKGLISLLSAINCRSITPTVLPMTTHSKRFVFQGNYGLFK